jgi:thiol-disulfide isomerase/thioredoxin
METREDLRNHLKNTTADTTIIKFTANWCRPCKMIQPVIEELNRFYTEKNINYEYIEIDVDESTDIYAFFKKMRMANGIPTLLSFKKSHYQDHSFYVPYKAITGADPRLVSQFFQLSLV